jgi:hypothetical protein
MLDPEIMTLPTLPASALVNSVISIFFSIVAFILLSSCPLCLRPQGRIFCLLKPRDLIRFSGASQVCYNSAHENPFWQNIMVSAIVLRELLLRGEPSADLIAKLLPNHMGLVEEGARLRAELPPYLSQRRALIDAHSPLIPPLQALVHGYAALTNTELWATGLGVARVP